MIFQYKTMFNFIWQREGGVNKLYKGKGVRQKVDQIWIGPQSTFRIHQQ